MLPHPKTLREAVDFLKAEMHPTNLEGLAKTGAVACHPTLGMAIRNELGLWNPHTPLVKWFKKTFEVDHADDISAIILGTLHSDLTGADYNAHAEARRFRLHWETAEAQPPAKLRTAKPGEVPPAPPSTRRRWFPFTLNRLKGA